MTEALFRDDSYLRECQATVVEAGPEGIILDRTVFYPMGGGQPGDTGSISWDGGSVNIVDTRYGDGGDIAHIPEEGASLPPAGASVELTLDWTPFLRTGHIAFRVYLTHQQKRGSAK